MENNTTQPSAPVSQPQVYQPKVDTFSYKGWLNSDSFFKRSFSILGYGMLAYLIILVPFYILIILVVVMVTVASK